jgi:FtsP/CotA-like multicopper oxidase with cupredoxin domain
MHFPPRRVAWSALFIALSTSATAADSNCAYREIDVDRYGRKPFQNPPSITSRQGGLDTPLVTQFTDPKTTSIAGCPLTLRTYNGQLVGPTLRVKPGDVMNIKLDNRMPKETPNEIEQQYLQEASNAYLSTRPHSFNTTNLHTHGLHVSPAGNSDNVLITVPPQTQFPYEIKLPKSHPPGSFWYHAHAHGSTSIQVGSGMAGALVIEDDEAKIPAALREANKGEKVLVFQTILYDTRGRLDNITALFPSPTNPADCSQPANQITWSCSKRRITINGQIVPIIKMRPGEVQRWRLIDTAYRESIQVQLEGHSLHEIALDGLYLGKVDTWPVGSAIDLQPGYRSDVLVQASLKPGKYRLIDQATKAAKSLRAVDEPENLLAEIVIEDAPMNMKLPTSAEMAALAPFPGVDLSKKATGLQQAVFTIGGLPNDNRAYFQINYQAFNPSQSRQLTLNNVDQWTLSAVGAPHVFHIHVNPFQFARTGPDGKPETVWKDTVLLSPSTAQTPLNMYTQYVDYIGQFVIHCHILDHEDLGMMEVVEVVTEPGSVAHGKHH